MWVRQTLVGEVRSCRRHDGAQGRVRCLVSAVELSYRHFEQIPNITLCPSPVYLFTRPQSSSLRLASTRMQSVEPHTVYPREIPAELLIRVILYCIPAPSRFSAQGRPDRFKERTYFPWKYTHVCRYWRDDIHGSPLIWQQSIVSVGDVVEFEGEELVRNADRQSADLDRADQLLQLSHPLSVSVFVIIPAACPLRILHLLQAYSSRITYLSWAFFLSTLEISPSRTPRVLCQTSKR